MAATTPNSRAVCSWPGCTSVLATSGGGKALYKAAPTREKADQFVNQRLAGTHRPPDAKIDLLYLYEALP